jgi:hypothetical protein
MGSVNVEIERTKTKFFIDRIKRELTTLNEGDQQHMFLSSILQNLPVETNELSKVLETAYENAFKKPWNKLQHYHKLQKLREYLNGKKLTVQERNKIETKVLKKIEDKESASKYITYDSENCVITRLLIDGKEC